MLATQTIKKAVTQVRPKTHGVRIGSEIRVGRDSTDDNAVWVYVAVPDDSIDEFNKEWDQLREEIRRRVYEALGDPDAYVYIRMRAISEAEDT